MTKKRGRTSQSSDAVVKDSSESGDGKEISEKTEEKSSCAHISVSLGPNVSKIAKDDQFGKPACSTCEKNNVVPQLGEATWLCLKCGARLCSLKHSKEHFITPRSESHSLTVKIPSFTVWCHYCDTEISIESNKKLNTLIVNLQAWYEKSTKRNNVENTNSEMAVVENGDSDGLMNKDYGQTYPRSSTVFGNLLGTEDEEPKRRRRLPTVPLSVHSKDSSSNNMAGEKCHRKLPEGPRVRGLSNLGNTCFFNSVLQCLARTPNLVDTLKTMSDRQSFEISLKSGETVSGELDSWDLLTSCLCETLTSLCSGPGVPLAPSRLLSLLRKKCSQFEGYDQHDAHELLRHLLDSVRNYDHKRYRKLLLNMLGVKDRGVHDVSEEVHQRVKALDRELTDAILLVPDQVFKGLLVSRLECQECQSLSCSVESFLDLSLPVSVDKPQPPRNKKYSADSYLDEKYEPVEQPSSAKTNRKMYKLKYLGCRRSPASGYVKPNNANQNSPTQEVATAVPNDEESDADLDEKYGPVEQPQPAKEHRKVKRNRCGRTVSTRSSITKTTVNSNESSPTNEVDSTAVPNDEESDADVEDNEELDRRLGESGYSSEKVNPESSGNEGGSPPGQICDTGVGGEDSARTSPSDQLVPSFSNASLPICQHCPPIPQNEVPDWLLGKLRINSELVVNDKDRGSGKGHPTPVKAIKPSPSRDKLQIDFELGRVSDLSGIELKQEWLHSSVRSGQPTSSVDLAFLTLNSRNVPLPIFCDPKHLQSSDPDWTTKLPSHYLSWREKVAVKLPLLDGSQVSVGTTTPNKKKKSANFCSGLSDIEESPGSDVSQNALTDEQVEDMGGADVGLLCKQVIEEENEEVAETECTESSGVVSGLSVDFSSLNVSTPSSLPRVPSQLENTQETPVKCESTVEALSDLCSGQLVAADLKLSVPNEVAVVESSSTEQVAVLRNAPGSPEMQSRNVCTSEDKQSASTATRITDTDLNSTFNLGSDPTTPNASPSLAVVSQISDGLLAHINSFRDRIESPKEVKPEPSEEDDNFNLCMLYTETKAEDYNANRNVNRAEPSSEDEDLHMEPLTGFDKDTSRSSRSPPRNKLAHGPYGEDSECTIHSCLRQFTAVEIMTGPNRVRCATCTARSNKGNKEAKPVYTMASKQLLIKQVPPVLILHLKRFQVQMYSFKKLSRHVEFPVLLDLGPFCTDEVKSTEGSLQYSLFGVVEHSGTLNGGHYVAYVKVEQEDSDPKWFYISDSSVNEVSECKVLKSQAYLLFYKQLKSS